MVGLFEAHREAEAARDIDAILETFTEECFLETIPLGLRSEGRDAVRAAYEQQFFRSSSFGGRCAGRVKANGSASLPAEERLPSHSRTSCPSRTDSWPANRSTSTWQRSASR